MKFRTLLFIALGIAVPATAFPQAQRSLQSLRVGYNTRKATVNPQGELKAQIDEVDRQLAEATRAGRTGEMRRLIAKGTTLLAGRPWTPEIDFQNSLVLRTEHVVADSSKPYTIRVEQIYAPAIQSSQSLTAHARLRQRPAAPAPGGAASEPAVVKDLGTVDGLGRDLRDTPSVLELDVHDVADGTYQLAVTMADGSHDLGTATLTVNLRKGLDDLVAKLEASAKTAPEALRADILFPVDRLRHVNLGRLELATFDPDKDIRDALAVAAAAKSGKNPFAGKTGDFKRHYLLETAAEIMPYRMYVPTGYSSGRAYPLVIALHGLGGTENSFFDGYDRSFPALAEKHGYIVAAPLGYRVDGGYGWGLGEPPADPVTRRSQDLSEQDVMRVLDLVKKQYKIDENRIYLAGHSLGAIGTWKLGPKYPDIWAALAPFSGSGAPNTLERIKHIPQFVVHGDNDPTVNVRGSRTMVAKMKELGIEVTYVEVPGGNHGSVVAPNFPAMFDFFDAHRKRSGSTSQQ
jgi:predicted esterase